MADESPCILSIQMELDVCGSSLKKNQMGQSKWPGAVCQPGVVGGLTLWLTYAPVCVEAHCFLLFQTK